MGYTVKTICFACALVWAVAAAAPVSAQTPSAIPTSTPELTPVSTAKPDTLPTAVSVTPTLSSTVVVTASVAQTALTPTATPEPLVTSAAQTTSEPDATDVPLEGTIVANRSEHTARFFVEGDMYELVAGRSQGLPLPRPSTVLNLYSCPAEMPESQPGCFWDPYLIQQDGFYELFSSPAATAVSKILLREAGTPPTDQVWVQNRTGATESVVFRSDIYEMPPTSVLEFPVATGVPAILYVRNCLALDGQQVCEWAPRTLDAGVYYSLVEVSTPGNQPGALVIAVDLRPVVVGEAKPDETPVSAPAQSVVCTLAVPTLNIRSGPGLQYEIIGKIRTVEGEPATVNVTGRSADGLWLTVDPTLSDLGWITATPSFVTCDSGVAALPIVEAAPVVVAPVPEVPVASGPPTPVSPEVTPEIVEPAPLPTTGPEPQAPAGYAQLVVTNGFQHVMRFTIDQTFRPFEGPSEYDLQPGEAVNVVVFPGQIAFTASSPWNGLSANSDLPVAADQSVHLWLRFELDGGGSWVLRWD